LPRVPIFTIMTYQGYDINGYMFYTEQQDKNMYYVQIQEIWELDFHGFKIPLFRSPGLMESRVLYKTSTGSLALTLTIKDVSQSLLC
jgi:hypothetical protein